MSVSLVACEYFLFVVPLMVDIWHTKIIIISPILRVLKVVIMM